MRQKFNGGEDTNTIMEQATFLLFSCEIQRSCMFIRLLVASCWLSKSIDKRGNEHVLFHLNHQTISNEERKVVTNIAVIVIIVGLLKMAKHLANILGNSGITTPVGKCTIIDGWLPTTGKWNEGGIFKGSDSNLYFHNVDPRLSQIDAMNQGIIGFRSGFLLFNWMDTRTRVYLPRFEWINTPKQPLNLSIATIRFTFISI
ncbi:uncharacterized protein EV154DRAFT_482187 [Mucor mucedo]|uniref:uncharacterized protein n=1 Tax=Mucor mucedo TaxID=29922 RepID=UPI00221EA607|nr:uncharacterized protein EV154DRAFT_482187 [Mucor mucedo]KAI7890460.1 hypothetical protein EV154DRAFT_482187 [Mucor mucedo]